MDKPTDLSAVPSVLMLEELKKRGGHPGALAEAALLCIKKSEDYNHGQAQDPHTVDRTGYFPLGTASYAQMLHTKSERFLSLTRKTMHGQIPNFEGLTDTALDIINYAGFYVGAERDKQRAARGEGLLQQKRG